MRLYRWIDLDNETANDGGQDRQACYIDTAEFMQTLCLYGRRPNVIISVWMDGLILECLN